MTKPRAIPEAGYIGLPNVDLFPHGPVRVAHNLWYWSERCQCWIRIPAGFVSDLLSVPWWGRWLIPQSGPGRNEAILHDYLCEDGRLPDGLREYPELDSRSVHLMFEEALIASDIPRWRRRVLSRAVLWFGPRFGRSDFPMEGHA